MFGIINENKSPFLDPKNLVSEQDIYSYTENLHSNSHSFLGAKIKNSGKAQGVQFTIWAPFAKAVSIVGNFNDWNPNSHVLVKVNESGIWSNWFQFELPELHYQYAIYQHNDEVKYINDPYATKLNFNSRFCTVFQNQKSYKWNDASWLSLRENNDLSQKAISILSFDFGNQEENPNKTYQSIAKELVEKAKLYKATHIEISSCIEKVIDFSLQGADGLNHQEFYYFAPCSNYGDIEDFKCLVDYCHQNSVGVILQLPFFDSISFSSINSYKHLERKQHVNFYLSNLMYWLEEFHIDGFNFSNIEFNISAKKLTALKEFFQKLSEMIHAKSIGILTIIEQAENLNQITKPAFLSGLGIKLKSSLNLINEIKEFCKAEDKELLSLATICSSIYAENTLLNLRYNENFNCSNDLLKIFMGLFFTIPGKKSIDSSFIASINNDPLQKYFQDLTCLYSSSQALYEGDFKSSCFEWNTGFASQYISFIRWAKNYKDCSIVIVNFSDQELLNLRIAVPDQGFYFQVINSDRKIYGGSGLDNDDGVYSSNNYEAGRPYSIVVDIAPRSLLVFKKQ